jgi:hypothetical protein
MWCVIPTPSCLLVGKFGVLNDYADLMVADDATSAQARKHGVTKMLLTAACKGQHQFPETMKQSSGRKSSDELPMDELCV